MVMTFTTHCQASPSIRRNPSGQDHNYNYCKPSCVTDRSKLVIHEVDEPPLGVPGELHFDDEEEEVERGGLDFIQEIL